MSRSGLGEQRARVGRVCGGVAADLQRFPQLHLLLLDKPELSQEVPPGAAEAGAGPLPRPGPLARLVQSFQDALRDRVFGQQQDPRTQLKRIVHLHAGDADVAGAWLKAVWSHVGEVQLCKGERLTGITSNS